MFNFTPKRNSNWYYNTVFSPCQMSKIKQLIVLIRAWANKNSYTLLVRVKNGITPLKVNFDIIYQIKMKIPLTGISLKDTLIHVHKEVVKHFPECRIFIIALFAAKYWTKCKFHQRGNDSVTDSSNKQWNTRQPLRNKAGGNGTYWEDTRPKHIKCTKTRHRTSCITSNHLCIKQNRKIFN